MDLLDNDALYFQNSNTYPIHFDFAKAHLNGPGDRAITTISDFNPQYTSLPDGQRRFLLGAVTYYEGPKVWALEIAPYDTSTPAMITKLFNAVKKAAFYGSALTFHPTSEAVEAQAKKLSPDIKVKTTNELFAAIDYQPLNLGEAVGTLKFVSAAELADHLRQLARPGRARRGSQRHQRHGGAHHRGVSDTALPHQRPRAQPQARRTWDCARRRHNPLLTALKGKQVRITVGLFDWKVVEVTQAESDAWWATHKPPKVTLTPISIRPSPTCATSQTVTVHTDTAPYVTLADIRAAIRAFGAKAPIIRSLPPTQDVPNKKAFGIPVFYYDQFMKENGFYDRVRAFQQDPEFVAKDDPFAT